MTRVGFIVEGPSDKKLIESQRFKDWLWDECKLEIVNPIIDAHGSGNMCSRKIPDLVDGLKKQAKPDRIVVLADLDPDQCAPCITERKKLIGSAGIDLVVIAKKAMESWFLADTKAMRRWTGDDTFYEPSPEDMDNMPWDRLKAIKNKNGRGPGDTKRIFARTIINKCHFDVRRAAKHPACPSARYFVERVCALGGMHDNGGCA